jgi:superfamily I DNA and RNA helicase
MKVRMRNAAELFGIGPDGEPRISLERAAAGLPSNFTNDTVLSKCYRNKREVLVTAHALGFGIIPISCNCWKALITGRMWATK